MKKLDSTKWVKNCAKAANYMAERYDWEIFEVVDNMIYATNLVAKKDLTEQFLKEAKQFPKLKAECEKRLNEIN